MRTFDRELRRYGLGGSVFEIFKYDRCSVFVIELFLLLEYFIYLKSFGFDSLMQVSLPPEELFVVSI